MPLIQAHGDIFESEAVGLVNPVNCLGVAGAGLARQFRDRWPVQMAEYTAFCKEGNLSPGKVHDISIPGGRRILNVPTKVDWRDQSRPDDISSGLSGLRRYVDETGIKSIAIPPLGCGLGGLPKKLVAGLVVAWFATSEADIHVYGLDLGRTT